MTRSQNVTFDTQRSGSLADILASNGYSQGDHAAAMIQSWDKIIDEVRPDLIIADHAPSALLSAHGRIPVALVGNGFAVPPADDDWFPPFNAGVGTIDAQRSVFDAISQGFERLGRPAPTSITAPFRGAFRGIYTFPVLDTYRAIRQEGLLGPIEPMPSLAPLPERRRIFIYSAAEIAKIDMLMQCIMAIGPEASVYLRGSPGPRAAILRSRGVEVFEGTSSIDADVDDFSSRSRRCWRVPTRGSLVDQPYLRAHLGRADADASAGCGWRGGDRGRRQLH